MDDDDNDKVGDVILDKVARSGGSLVVNGEGSGLEIFVLVESPLVALSELTVSADTFCCFVILLGGMFEM